MMAQQRKEWVLALKVGDFVAVNRDHRTGVPAWYIHQVEEVKAPKPERKRQAKQVVRITDEWFDEDGELTRGTDWNRHTLYIVPVTDEIRQAAARRRLLAKIEKTDWKSLATDTLVEIAALLR